MKRIVIFASGAGTNAVNIIKYFKNHQSINVAALFCNKKDADVVTKAKNEGIDVEIFDRDEFYNTQNLLKNLQKYDTHYIVLAGFLWLIPEYILNHFKNKIINIHPALLPKYGGKGMYGKNVHKAVLDNKETETGITIHLIDHEYDKGEILFQAKCKIDYEFDKVEDIADKVKILEHKHYPEVIEKYIGGQ